MTSRAIKSRNIGDTSCITVETSITIQTIVLVDLFGPRVVSTSVTLILLAFVNFIISFGRAIMTGRAFFSSALTILTKISRLTMDAISNLSGRGHHRLGFERTRNGD